MKINPTDFAKVAIALLTSLLCSCGNYSGDGAPTSLRCEYQDGPEIVIDTKAPRLSWINGVDQTACQILVATSKCGLKEGKADVWDSGKIETSQSHLFAYSGPDMQSMKEYWWTVRVWDKNGKATGWSKPSHWTVGMMDPAEWKADWIGAPWQDDSNPEGYCDAPLLRKEFTVRKGLVRAKAFICGLGWFEMNVNGEKVGDDFFAPGLTDYTERPKLLNNPRIPLDPAVTAYRTLYVTYDITSRLHKGVNAIGAILGNGYFHSGQFNEYKNENYGVPRLICQILLEYADGSSEMVCTDGSWKACKSPIVFNDLYKGEIYDARLETAGWDMPGLDDSSWENAETKAAPMGRLTANMGPLDKVTETLKPQTFEKQEDGSYKIDFGKEISGWTRFTGITGKQGDTLRVRFTSESPNGTYTYIFGKDGKASAAAKFTWFAFREAIVSGIENLHAENVVAEAVNSDVKTNADFECSNPLFEQIETIWRRSQMDNMHACVASDCPHREKLPYTGDGQIAMPMVLANFDAAAFYNKWLGDILGSQNPKDGYVPNGAPWEPWCGGGPAWGAAICVMPWEFFLEYGDRDQLAKSLEPMKAYTGYMMSWKRENGTVLVQKSKPDGTPFYWYNLGDWAPAYQFPTEDLVHSFYAWICASTTAKAAKALGDEAAASEYSAIAEEIKTAFNTVFYNEEEKSYGDFGSNVFALYMGVPEDRLADVRETLRNELMVKYNGHLNVGFIAHRFIYEVLALNGMNDVACTILNQKDFPSFGWWIEQGATTTWEEWNGNNSRNHPMFGGGLVWFYKMLAGVNSDPEDPGFRHIIVRPIPAKGIDNVSYAKETPYGTLVSKVNLDGDSVSMEVTVPCGARATVFVPKGAEAVISNPLCDDNYEIHEVGSGTHRFGN